MVDPLDWPQLFPHLPSDEAGTGAGRDASESGRGVSGSGRGVSESGKGVSGSGRGVSESARDVSGSGRDAAELQNPNPSESLPRQQLRLVDASQGGAEAAEAMSVTAGLPTSRGAPGRSGKGCIGRKGGVWMG